MIESLIVRLLDPAPQRRWGAAEQLGRTRDPLAYAPLLEIAISDTNAEVRRHAVLALGALGDVRAVGFLIAMLGDPDVDYAAASALGLLGDPRAIPALVDVLDRGRSDDDPHARALRLRTIRALATLDATTTEYALLAILTDAREEMCMRVETARALGKLRSTAAIDALVRVGDEPGASADPSADLHAAALRAIGAIGGERATAVLVPLLAARCDSDSDDPGIIAAALADTGDRTAVPTLAAWLRALLDLSAPTPRQQWHGEMAIHALAALDADHDLVRAASKAGVDAWQAAAASALGLVQ